MSSPKRQRAARWLRGAGIEIGALDNPLAVPAGVEVRYVDRVPTERLHEQYRELAGATFVPTSIIGDAQDLSALADESVDFVIANHLIEHLENPIRGLAEMARVVRPGGVLYMALPDPRVTFDVDRELTSVDHLLDEYRNGTQHTREAHFTEWVERAEKNVEWMRKAQVKTGPERVAELLELDYSIHFHVWRPDTFLELLVVAMREAGLQLELVEFIPRLPDDDEFIFVFLKGVAGPEMAVPALPEELRVAELGAAVAALQTANESLRDDLRTVKEQLATVTTSRSWLVTRPLRAMTEAARRLRRQAGAPGR